MKMRNGGEEFVEPGDGESDGLQGSRRVAADAIGDQSRDEDSMGSSPMGSASLSISINALSALTGGALTVSRGLVEGLATAMPSWRFELICSLEEAAPTSRPPNLRVEILPEGRSLVKRWRWEQFSAPQRARRDGIDAMLLLGGFTPMLSATPMVSVWQNANIWTPPHADLPRSLRGYIHAQRLVMRASVRRAARNVFLSADSLDRCREIMSVPAGTTHIIPLGLGSSERQPDSPPSHAEREPVVLSVGDLYAHKGHELTIEAMARLKDVVPGLRLVIAGGSADDEGRSRLMRLAERMGVEDRVELLGSIPRDRVFELYRRSIVYVTASRLESFGLTPIEAMSCGLPVVSSRMSAAPEVCGPAAEYFEPYDAVALARAVERVLASGSEWSRRQALSIERARRFDWGHVAREYVQLLKDACS